MRLEIKDNRRTRLITSKYTKKSWLENSSGKRITSKFKKVREINEGPYIILRTTRGSYVYHEKLDEIVFWNMFEDVYVNTLSDNLYRLSWYDHSKYGYHHFIRIYDSKGRILHTGFSEVKCMSNGRVAFEKDGHWGFMDENGKIVIPASWEEVEDFNKYGYSVVSFKDGKRTALINKSGTYVIAPCEYSKYNFISQDLIITTKGNKVGLINLKAKEIIPHIYDDIKVSGDYYIVRHNKKYGLLDAEGNVVFECIYPEIIETPEKFVVQDFARQEVLKSKEVSKG